MTMKANFDDLIQSEVPVLVDFYADWCGPCKMMAPILEDVKSQLGDSVKIFKIDVDRHQALSGKYGIRSIPTMILFKNGQTIWRHSGVMQPGEIVRNITAQS
jgi:thioredoxin 1